MLHPLRMRTGTGIHIVHVIISIVETTFSMPRVTANEPAGGAKRGYMDPTEEEIRVSAFTTLGCPSDSVSLIAHWCDYCSSRTVTVFISRMIRFGISFAISVLGRKG